MTGKGNVGERGGGSEAREVEGAISRRFHKGVRSFGVAVLPARWC